MDGSLFGNDAGEDEQPDILNSYFVDQPGFRPFLSRENLFRVARSRKGMGKSALISKLAYDLEQNTDLIVVKITGASLIGLISPPKNESHLKIQNYWSRVICTRINHAVGNHFGYSFSDNNLAIIDAPELTSFSGRNLAQSLLQRVKTQRSPIETTYNPISLKSVDLATLFEQPTRKSVWLLVDDIDSTYVDTEDQQMVTSTFFSACRSLVRDVQGLHIRASVRTDVWSNLRRNEDPDKCEQYVTDISWSAADMNVILSKKVYSYFSRRDLKSPAIDGIDYRRDVDELMKLAFADRIRWGSGMVPPFRPVYILSAGRPRWMSQLCRLAGVEASKHQKEVIGTTEINGVMKVYSRFRLNDIYKEHSHQYEGLQKLIETFSNSPSRYTTGDLLTQLAKNYLNLVGAGNVPDLDGYPFQRPLQLAHFLFKIGFIVGRREQIGNSSIAEFVRYEERPELLVDGRNTDDGLLWEIHPAYREALNIGKEQREAKGAQRARSLPKTPASPNRRNNGDTQGVRNRNRNGRPPRRNPSK